jgi:nitrate/nitrite transporter NarK
MATLADTTLSKMKWRLLPFLLVGGFAGPYLVGYVREASGSFQLGLLFLAVCPFVTALILYAMTGRSTVEEAPHRAKSSAPAH